MYFQVKRDEEQKKNCRTGLLSTENLLKNGCYVHNEVHLLKNTSNLFIYLFLFLFIAFIKFGYVKWHQQKAKLFKCGSSNQKSELDMFYIIQFFAGCFFILFIYLAIS